MKIRSFRLRILVLSVVVSGLVILGFGAWTWTMIHDLTGIHRLDSELVALASGQASAPADGRAWRAFEDALARLSEADPTHQLAFAVLSRSGEIIYRSAPWPEELLPRLGHPENSPPHPRTVFLNASAWRVALQHRPERSLIVAADMGPYLAHAHRLQAAFLLAFVMALGCAGGGAWFLAWQAVRPLTALIEATEGITAQALEQRIPQRGLGDEFDQLIQVFNEMLERLERSLGSCITISSHRTSLQDVRFAFAQLVEMAVRALSPGVNDPTTARHCVDRITGGLCRLVARIQPDPFRRDADGAARLRTRLVGLESLLRDVVLPVARCAGPHLDVWLRLIALLRDASAAAVDAATRQPIEQLGRDVALRARARFDTEPELRQLAEASVAFAPALAMPGDDARRTTVQDLHEPSAAGAL